tara:strand:- start:894 stop:3032 length:2139 start_codon:yes stop_codon:yes gene_type:complete
MLHPYSHRENAVRAHTRATILNVIQQKRLNSFKQGRINVRKEVRRQRRLRNNLEKMAFRRLSSLLPKHIRTQASIFKSSGTFSTVSSNRQLENNVFTVMKRHYRKIFITVFKDNEARYEKINKSVDVAVFGRNRDIERLIDVYNNDRNLFLANMTQSITRNIQNVITKGRADGLSLNQISRNIRNTAPIAKRRAAAIARTETHNAVSFAQHEYHGIVQNEYGVSMMKKWAATNDLRTRSAHSAVNGQTRAMDEPFDVGGAQMMHAGDPKGGAKNVINCRCVIIYVDADEIEEAVDTTAPSRKPVNDFGEQHPDEIKPNKESFKGDENISIVNRKSQPLNNVTHIRKGAFFNHSGTINMGSNYGRSGASYNSVWRHEKGHAFDYDTKLMSMLGSYAGRAKYINNDHDKLMRSKIKNAVDIESDKFRGVGSGESTYGGRFGISTFMAKQILDDRKLLRKRNNDIKKKRKNKDLEKDTRYNYFQLGVSPKLVTKTREIEVLGEKRTITDDKTIWDTNLSKTEFVKKWKSELDKSESILKYDDLKVLYGDDFLESAYDIAKLPNNMETSYFGTGKSFSDLSSWLTNLKYNNLGNGSDWLKSNFNYYLAKSQKSESIKDIVNFSDLIGSITNNSVMDGHAKSYYAKMPKLVTGLSDGHLTETFANFTCLLGSKNADLWRKVLAYHTPDSLKEYDEIMETLAKAKAIDEADVALMDLT